MRKARQQLEEQLLVLQWLLKTWKPDITLRLVGKIWVVIGEPTEGGQLVQQEQISRIVNKYGMDIRRIDLVPGGGFLLLQSAHVHPLTAWTCTCHCMQPLSDVSCALASLLSFALSWCDLPPSIHPQLAPVLPALEHVSPPP